MHAQLTPQTSGSVRDGASEELWSTALPAHAAAPCRLPRMASSREPSRAHKRTHGRCSAKGETCEDSEATDATVSNEGDGFEEARAKDGGKLETKALASF
jgi:hypothetical protein